MPLYTYKCDNCGEIFDLRVSVAAAGDSQTCDCGSLASRHYGQSPKIIMRPSGWNLREGDPGYDSKFEPRNIQSWMVK